MHSPRRHLTASRPWARGLAIAALGIFLGAGDCGEVVVPPPGVGGLDGVLAFEAPTDLVFSEKLAVGSHFTVTARSQVAGAVAFTGDVGVGTTDADKATVVLGNVSDDAVTMDIVIHAPGLVRFALTQDGEVVDRFTLTGVQPELTRLVDSVLVVSGSVDATAPAKFAILDERNTRFLVAAVDRCGGAVLDLGASTLEASNDNAQASLPEISATGVDGLEGYTLEGQGEVSFDLILKTPGLEDLLYNVKVVDPDSVDEVKAVPASVDDTAVTLWGRAFANDVEVIGLDFSWSATERVTLDVVEGPVAIANISFPTDDTVDDRDAAIVVETLGEDSTLDLLALQTTSLRSARDAPPLRPGEDTTTDDTSTAVGCGGCGETVEACDPLAAGLVPGFFLWRLRRRSKTKDRGRARP